MMILKMNQLKRYCLILGFLCGGRAGALDAFECVRDLMPITEAAAFQSKRQSVERPFMASPQFMVFPEVGSVGLTGFYIYSQGKAWYYDSTRARRSRVPAQPITDIKVDAEHTLLELVAQPLGLESVILRYLPGFGVKETTRSGPVMLGSSVLPVIGALVSRSDEQLRLIYNNPDEFSETELKQWIHSRSARRPANAKDIQIHRKMLQLSTLNSKTGEALWKPLKDELRLRKLWVQEHNLDEDSFKKLSLVLQSSCKE